MALALFVAGCDRDRGAETGSAEGASSSSSSGSIVVGCDALADGAACALEDGGAGACATVDEPESPDFGEHFCAAPAPPCGATPPAGGCLCALDCPTPPPGASSVCDEGVCSVEGCSSADDCPPPPKSPEDTPTVDVTDCFRAECSAGACSYSHVIDGAFFSQWKIGDYVTCIDGRVGTITHGDWPK